ncbi:DUF4825 domain-containing protein [Halobacillus sp. Marseille-Q1614]|uniref:DUF4825 domain-containing protein n=1 Tax=Halobacillus sp. Marseille-Q1614 TaxID=2709134 RepID=UPI0015706339|nr:DUF4825 domain-containing protein [Halobacillus sp. Marseille-Q1614]
MKKKTIILTLLAVIFLSGCQSMNQADSQTKEDVFEYEDSLIGDNSAIINIIGQLEHSEEFKEVTLQSKEVPYGMTLTYEGIEQTEIEKEYRETAIYNATFLFVLVENAEWAAFQFDDQEYKLTKEQLSKWYDTDLSGLSNEQEVKDLIQEAMSEESKVEVLF